MLRKIVSNLYIFTWIVQATYHVDFALEAMENTAKGDSEATGYRWGQQEVKDSYESKWVVAEQNQQNLYKIVWEKEVLVSSEP